LTDWRTDHGLTPKPRRNCPVCGVESVAGRACRYHKRTEKRTEYHSAYYRANAERLRGPARERRARWRLMSKVRPLINILNEAVDIGRMTANW
jgi:hypothetical protein